MHHNQTTAMQHWGHQSTSVVTWSEPCSSFMSAISAEEAACAEDPSCPTWDAGGASTADVTAGSKTAASAAIEAVEGTDCCADIIPSDADLASAFAAPKSATAAVATSRPPVPPPAACCELMGAAGTVPSSDAAQSTVFHREEFSDLKPAACVSCGPDKSQFVDVLGRRLRQNRTYTCTEQRQLSPRDFSDIKAA